MKTSSHCAAEPQFSRRSFFHYAAGASALATLPILTEAKLAYAGRNRYADSSIGIHIDANENPMGPCEAARMAMIDVLPRGGRYLYDHETDLAALFARQEGLTPEYVRAFAGSSEPLHFSALLFCDKNRPLVLADPGYEAPIYAAKVVGAPVIRVPLADPKCAATHDVKAMLAASPTPGLIYLCNPNNPTGTITPRAAIEAMVNNLPKGAILLVDEAYIHFSEESSALDFVKQGKDVIVLRTFSKLYGMAGLRMGFLVARPDLLKRYEDYGLNGLPITALAAAKASLLDPDLVPTRRKSMADVREQTLDWLREKGWACTPSVSNCFMIDVKRPGKEVIAALAAKEVFIGRLWPSWPTHVRVTVGTREEMAAFRTAFAEVMASPTAALTPPPLPAGLEGRAFTHLS